MSKIDTAQEGGDIDSFILGLKRREPITLEIDFNAPLLASTCTATPCSHCGGCSVCKDFHGNAYGGCTEQTCPLLKERKRKSTKRQEALMLRWAWLREDGALEVCDETMTRAFMRVERKYFRKRDRIIRVRISIEYT